MRSFEVKLCECEIISHSLVWQQWEGRGEFEFVGKAIEPIGRIKRRVGVCEVGRQMVEDSLC